MNFIAMLLKIEVTKGINTREMLCWNACLPVTFLLETFLLYIIGNYLSDFTCYQDITFTEIKNIIIQILQDI